ncbi:MAG: GC-type dockerin domain-anchored protein [Planctomycetota bacterium]
MRRMLLVPFVLFAATSVAQFETPDAYGWSRTDANTTYYAWDDFVQTCGSPPDIANTPAMVDNVVPFVCEVGGGSFITSTLNIYSISSVTEYEVEIPVDGVAGDTVDVLVQVRTLGREIDYPEARVGGVPLTIRDELLRVNLGPDAQFGGDLVDVAMFFEGVPYSNPLLLTFESEDTSMSLEQLSIDTVSRGTTCLADVNADGNLTPADFNAWILAFNTGAVSCDQNGNGVCEPGDFNAWILNFNAGC